MTISVRMQTNLVCPVTKKTLITSGDVLEVLGEPGVRYPIVDDIPILIDQNRSLFSIEDFTAKVNTTFDLKRGLLKKIYNKMRPSIGFNVRADKNYAELVKLLPQNAKVLVVGGSVQGDGMEELFSKGFEIVSSDVSFGPYTDVIFDAHDIPFRGETFDCVVIQAVLEHVVDPQRCVDEIFRVLKKGGVVYAETPFMQQVHLKQYDFTRFTHLGHRRLFRHFSEIDSGPVCGPGMALAWSYLYFLRSFASSRIMMRILSDFARFTSFFLKYFDYYLINRPGSYDAASGFFFMGQKSELVLSDRDLIGQFRGVR